MTYVVLDPMTDTNGTSLVSHDGTVGTPWVSHSVSSGTWLCQSNRFYPSVAGLMYTSGDPGIADYYVECTYRYLTNTGAVGAAGRMSTSQNTAYYWYHNANEWVLNSVVNGTVTNPALGTYAQTLTASTDYTVRLDMQGTAIRLIVDGVERISVTDSAITAVGRAGLRSAAGVTTTTGKHISNYQAVNALGIDFSAYIIEM